MQFWPTMIVESAGLPIGCIQCNLSRPQCKIFRSGNGIYSFQACTCTACTEARLCKCGWWGPSAVGKQWGYMQGTEFTKVMQLYTLNLFDLYFLLSAFFYHLGCKKAALEQLNNMHIALAYCLGYLHFTSKYSTIPTFHNKIEWRGCHRATSFNDQVHTIPHSV